MVKPASRPKHLRLYTEQPPKAVRPPIEAVACLPRLFRAFQAATQWTLRYVPTSKADSSAESAWSAPVYGGEKAVTGFLALQHDQRGTERGRQPEERKAGRSAPTPEFALPRPETISSLAPSLAHGPIAVDRDVARALAGSIADLLSELLQTRHALQQREAELAAGVPVVPHRDDEKHLAARLEAVLRAGVEAVDGTAAALYLLDDATTELKLRSSWGLPFDRLTAPARPLQGAVADLEALLGHAVVINDHDAREMWRVPEDFPASVCVPVSTPTMLLGTFWVFCNGRRGFSDHETNILEVVAGRLASDLEREMLLRVGVDGAELQKQVGAAERLQRNTLPTVAPLLEGWDVAGWTAQAGGVGGAFHDWFCLPDGLLATAVGRAAERGVVGALTANAVKTALRAHARYQRQTERILQQVNLTLWTGSASDQHTGLFCGLIETATGRVCCASAGKPTILVLRGDGWKSLSQSSAFLGESPETDFQQFGYELQPGEVLVVLSDGLRGAADAAGHSSHEATLADAMLDKLDLSADELVVLAREAIHAHATTSGRFDQAILVVRRTTA